MSVFDKPLEEVYTCNVAEGEQYVKVVDSGETKETEETEEIEETTENKEVILMDKPKLNKEEYVFSTSWEIEE